MKFFMQKKIKEPTLIIKELGFQKKILNECLFGSNLNSSKI